MVRAGHPLRCAALYPQLHCAESAARVHHYVLELGSLHAGKVEYYDKEGGELKGDFSVFDADDVRESTLPTAKPYEIEIVTAERVWRVYAADSADMNEWIKVLRYHLDATVRLLQCTVFTTKYRLSH